jgi:hypothetical protein
MLYMFRTILVHLQEQLYKAYIAFVICWYTSGFCVAVATQQPDVYQWRKYSGYMGLNEQLSASEGSMFSTICRM